MKKEKLLLRQVQISCGRNVNIPGFSLNLYEHDCYSILCENMETSSALTDLFRGNCSISGGMLRYDGKPVKAGELSRRLQREVAVIGQRSKLIRALSIPENICMFSDVKKWNYKKNFLEKSRELAERFALNIDFSKSVDLLDDNERIVIELLKAYAEKKRIVVFTVFSTFLSDKAMEEIHGIVKLMLGEEQPISFILIENPGDAALDWSERVQIIKNGMNYGSFQTEFLNRQKLYAFYSGRHGENRYVSGEAFSGYESEEDTFEFRAVSTDILENVSFSVSGGEFLNIFCLDAGSIQGIYRAVSGMDPVKQGNIYLEGKKVRLRSLKDMRKKRICYCKARAYESMVFPDMTVRENIGIDLSKKIRNPYIQRKYIKSMDGFIDAVLGKGCGGRKVQDLSITDRQKLAFLKIYMMAPKLLVCEQPFFDADTQMKEVTRDALRRLADRGIAIIILLSNLEQLHWFEGDVLYLNAGKPAQEDEIYHALYQM